MADNTILEEFKIDWVMLPKEDKIPINNCSYTKVVSSAAKINLTTPGYPFGYAENLNCSWTFLPQDKGRHVVLEVYDVLLEEEDCSRDYIKVMSSHNLISWHDEQTMCTNKTKSIFPIWNPVAVFDGTPNLKIDFVTDCNEKFDFR